MDIISLAMTFLLQNPDIIINGVKKITKPGEVNVTQMHESFADLSRGILICYHRTARYKYANIVEQHWPRQFQYSADNSIVISIHYYGTSKTSYEMQVAVLQKEDKIRSVVLTDNALVPYNKKCLLEKWNGL